MTIYVNNIAVAYLSLTNIYTHVLNENHVLQLSLSQTRTDVLLLFDNVYLFTFDTNNTRQNETLNFIPKIFINLIKTR